MNFPLHFHEEYELNLILNASGTRRVVGNHEAVINDCELVLVGPNVIHGWLPHQCLSDEITEVTIQWHKDLLDEKFLMRNQLNYIKRLFDSSARGISFSRETILAMSSRILSLDKLRGFDSVMELFSILHDLSVSRNMVTLSDSAITHEQSLNFRSRRIEMAFEYMNQNYFNPISLQDVAGIASMNEVSFSRFIRKRTGYTFIESLTDIRISHAARLLIDTTNSIAEISYSCGFQNLSNFNRVFRKKKNCTPKEFRENFLGVRVFV